MLPGLFDEAFLNPKHGARADSKKLIFTLTDGKMDDQSGSIFAKNGCSGQNETCWLANLETSLGESAADADLYAIGVGTQQGASTLNLLADQDTGHVLSKSLFHGYAKTKLLCQVSAHMSFWYCCW